jgi:hypothetical protein
LGSHAPVYVGEYRLFFEIYCSEDSAAYFGSPRGCIKEGGCLSVLRTFLTKNYGLDISEVDRETFALYLQWISPEAALSRE